MFLQNTDILDLYVLYESYETLYRTCHIAVRLHVYELTSIWGAGGDGGSVRAILGGAKQETAVRDAVSTFVHVKPLDIFNEMS